MRATASSRLSGVMAARAPAGPAISQTRAATPLLRVRTAACAASRVACSFRAAPPQHRAPLSREAPGRAAFAQRCHVSLPLLRARGSGGAEPPPEGDLTPLLVTYGGGVAGTLAVAALAYFGADTWLNNDDVFYGSSAGLSPGDVAGALLWSVSLYFASPLQLLLLFLGRIDVERPSDFTLLLLGQATGQPVNEASYEAPSSLRVANAAVFLVAGCLVAWALSASLGGEATWSVSTGTGAVLAAGVYEIGRPKRLSGAQQESLEAEWRDFKAFADARLARRGRCHARDVELAYRRFSPAYNARRRDGEVSANAAGDADLRNFLLNWYPAAERTAGGFYKGISVLPEGAEASTASQS